MEKLNRKNFDEKYKEFASRVYLVDPHVPQTWKNDVFTINEDGRRHTYVHHMGPVHAGWYVMIEMFGYDWKEFGDMRCAKHFVYVVVDR